MYEVLSFSNVMKVGKLGLVCGCLLVMVTGCSSRLQTTVMSATEPPTKLQIAKLEPETPQAEAAVQTPLQAEKVMGIPPIDIPVEAPARPVIRPSAPADIFATPRTGVSEPAVPAPLEVPLVVEPVAPPPPVITDIQSPMTSQESPKVLGIPSISFEPEKPTLPTIREEGAPPEELIARVKPEPVQESIAAAPSSIEEKPVEPVEQAPNSPEPVQIAKVVPAAPELMESKTEDILKALGDVYFDYDRFTIRNDAISVLQENAQVLVAGLSDKHIVIEGHCDERGTESYNMVLGKRRANAVKEFLVDLGVPGEQLQVMSYGKERPFCMDQNEQCWQENRRGHFVLK